MTWVRVDDHLPDHPKVLALGRDRMAAMGLWLIGNCYAARHLSDGFIPLAALPAGSARLARLLVDVGMWAESRDGYRIHDYDEYQPTKARVLAERAKNRERLQRWRNGVGNPVTPAVSNAASNGNPVPSRPVPVIYNPPTPLTEDERSEAIAHNRSLIEDSQDPAIARAARKALEKLGAQP
jgi:hypothetical protein